MSPQELQETRDELVLLKAERKRRHLGGRVSSAENGGENVSRIYTSYADLVTRIRELEAEIRAADPGPCGYGAIHLR